MSGTVADMLIMRVPEEVTPQRPGEFVFIGRQLNVSAGASLYDDPKKEYFMRQVLLTQADYWVRDQSKGAVRIAWHSIHATITNDPQTVSDWPLPHDCDDCRDGVQKALAAAEQGTWVALCRLEYDES